MFVAALAIEEVIRYSLNGKRRQDNAKALETLRSRGGPGLGLTDFQVAEQQGWQTKKAQAALRRLEKSGQVMQSNGHWYLTGAVIGRPAKSGYLSGH